MEHQIILWIVVGAALFYTFGYFASQKLIQAIDREEAPESAERHDSRASVKRVSRTFLIAVSVAILAGIAVASSVGFTDAFSSIID